MSRQLKILWLSHFVPYPPVGGNLQRTHHLLREAGRRHHVVLGALNQRALLPTEGDLVSAVDALRDHCRDIIAVNNEWDGSRLRRLALLAVAPWHPLPFAVLRFNSWRFHQRIRQLAATQRFDLIHVDYIGLVPYTRYFRSTPCVLNHHNVESQLVERRAEREPGLVARAYFRREAAKLARLERTACRNVVVNLTVSPLDAERLSRNAGEVPTVVVENGVDVAFFSPGHADASQPWHLVFAGTLSWYPNQEAARYLLNEIWPQVVARQPSARLTIVGREPGPDLLRAAAVDQRVSVPGRVDDVRPYLAAASTYVCPIRDGGGTRLKVLDALAAGKPLVATELAVEGLGMVEGRHYLRAETPEDFARAIEKLEADPALRRRLVSAGREHVVNRFAWTAVAERLEAAYQLALRSRPHEVLHQRHTSAISLR